MILATKQRRERLVRRAMPTLGELLENLSIEKRVAYEICESYYSKCVCKTAPEKPACERIVGAARYVVDMVRRHDLRGKPPVFGGDQ